MNRRAIFRLILFTAAFVIPLVTFEVLLRVFAPQPYLFPRYEYSERFGLVLPKSTVMVHELSGEWRFSYTINEYGLRAPMPRVSNIYLRPNVVMLGDSYTFGIGVNDDETYSQILNDILKDRANVVNLGVPGYGLTQQIRQFYEIGMMFEPEIVCIQFTNNDVVENFRNRVVNVVDGRFVFERDESFGNFLKWARDFLSDSFVQYSHLYNYVRYVVAKRYLYGEAIEENRIRHIESVEGDLKPDYRAATQGFYNTLIQTFAQDLKRRGIELMFFSVNGHLAKFPQIGQRIQNLETAGLLKYVATEPWFENMIDYGSPEGHKWGAKAHSLIGRNLAKVLLSEM